MGLWRGPPAGRGAAGRFEGRNVPSGCICKGPSSGSLFPTGSFVDSQACFSVFQDLAEPFLAFIPEAQAGAPRPQGPGWGQAVFGSGAPFPCPLAHRRLEQNFFNCSCDIRWMQLWQEQGAAKLNSQNLYCISAEGAQLPLFRMNISQCGERAAPHAPEPGQPGTPLWSFLSLLIAPESLLWALLVCHSRVSGPPASGTSEVLSEKQVLGPSHRLTRSGCLGAVPETRTSGRLPLGA